MDSHTYGVVIDLLLGLTFVAVGLDDLVQWFKTRARGAGPDKTGMSPIVETSRSSTSPPPGGESSNRCVTCGQPANYLGQEYNLELSRSGQEYESLDIYFCSWSHLQEWVGLGEPNFAYYAEPETWVDRVLGIGCIVAVLAMLGLMVIGALSLVEEVF